MEAWLAKKPVLINEKCEVLKGHCEKSNGGLYFDDYDSFSDCMNLLISNKVLCENMGKNGYDYVMKNYTWETVVKKYSNFLHSCLST